MRDEILRKIKEFADEAHGEQLRKYTAQRYIVHPVEVMEICSGYTSDISMLAAALLHDVIEDTPVTAGEIETFLLTVMEPEAAKKAVRLTVALTDLYTKAAYPALNRKARKHQEHARCALISAEAQTIKYADIISNAVDITKHDRNFAPRYLREMNQLLRVMNKGDAALYALAVKTVRNCLEEISAG